MSRSLAICFLFGFFARNVSSVMDPLPLDVGLRRLFEGNRFRVRSGSWLVTKVYVLHSALLIEFGTPHLRRVIVDLPDGVDLNEPEHVAWLYHNVETALEK